MMVTVNEQIEEKIDLTTLEALSVEDKENLAKFDKEKTFFERLQRKTDRFVIGAREISSRGMSFMIAMLGVLLQASHTSLLMYDVSGFSSVILRVLVAMGIGIFISCALAIFTIKSDGKNRKILQIINIFFYFEVFTNLFYYFNSLIFSKVDSNWNFANVDSKNWLYLIIAVPFAIIVPFAIKQFAGVISADDKLDFGTVEGPQEVLVDLTGDQLELINNLYADVQRLKNETAKTDFKLDSIEDFKEEVRKLKKLNNENVKRGETMLVDIDGKRTSVTIK
jgi:hypothetical protein